MSLADIVKEIGGDLYGPGRAVIPGPGHGPLDRSVSLLVDPSGRLVVTSFGRSSWQEVVDDLRRRGFIDRDKRLTGAGSGRGYHGQVREPAIPKAARIRAAAAIWAAAGPIAGTASARHFAWRAITSPPAGVEVFRHHPEAPLRAYDPAQRRGRPALVTAVRDPEGDLCAVEVAFLDPGGEPARGLRLKRKVIGVLPEGCSVRLHPPADEMLVGEGVFTSLAAHDRFGLPAEAALSTSRLVTWRPDPAVRAVLVAGDRGPGGRRAAGVLVARLRDFGLRAWAEFPPRGFGDFNDLARAARVAEAGAEREREGRGGRTSAGWARPRAGEVL